MTLPNEIILMSYWEHVKAEKDLARYLPPTDKRRIKLNEAANKLLDQLDKSTYFIHNR